MFALAFAACTFFVTKSGLYTLKQLISSSFGTSEINAT